MIEITKLTCSAEIGGIIVFKCPQCKTTQIAHSIFVTKGFCYEINDKCSDCWAKSVAFARGGYVDVKPELVGERCSDFTVARRKDEIIDSRPSTIAHVDLGAVLDDVEQLLTETDNANTLQH